MPLLKARGVYRRVGTIVQPSEAGQLWLAAQGFLHDVFARLAPEAHAAGAFTAPPTLDLVTPCAAAAWRIAASRPGGRSTRCCPARREPFA